MKKVLIVRKIFTDDEIEFIKNNYQTMSKQEMADVLGKTKKQVKGKCDTLKLKMNKYVSFSKCDEDFITLNYNKMTTKEISDHLGYTVKQINDKAYKMGINKDIFRHDVNEDVFELIDNEEKAYWLGFLYADGCISEIYNKNTGNLKGRTLDVGLSHVDIDHLRKLSNLISKTSNIKIRDIKLKGSYFKTCRLQVYNKKICSDLIKLGCTPRKSLTIKFPSVEILPFKLIRHFIRGYFDGDGCAHYSTKHQCVVSFMGTESFLLELRNHMKKYGFSENSIRKINGAYEVRWGGNDNYRKWYKYLYKNADVYLERKKNKFEELIS